MIDGAAETGRPDPRPLRRPTRRYAYLTDAEAIYRESFATIRAEADLTRLAPDAQTVAVRMIHACGAVDLPADLDVHPRLVATARAALQAGA
ncbi:MAG: precorrin-8X methylmutase, partial [Actinomycetes bacterium]